MEEHKIIVESEDEKALRNQLEQRHDPEAKRLLRFLAMPDLTRTTGSPVRELVERILKIDRFSDFDDVKAPEITPTDISFDLFNFPLDHPARKPTDTYYADKNHILRTHTTVMWYYWLDRPEIKEKIKNKESVGAFCYGKVYRKDEIDRSHMPVFHQMDGWYLAPKKEKIITIDDLKEVLVEIVQSVFGKGVNYRFAKEEFPYTDPSIEIEIERNSGPDASVGVKWVEILGSGVVRPVVLKNLGVDPEDYNGWAFGFGLERLAIVSMELPDIRLLWSQDERVKSQLKLGNIYKEVSKFPPITRDISFVVSDDFVPNNYFDLIRDLGGDLVEEVKLIDKYEAPEKFGAGKTSYTYRIIYRSNERTLLSDEIDPLQDKIYKETAKQFGAELR